MSLVGSLEDLNLGDILQIISLSRKSGVLYLTRVHPSQGGQRTGARIVFKNGQTISAALSSKRKRMGELFVEKNLATQAQVKDALRVVAESANRIRLDEALAGAFHIDREPLQDAVRAYIEDVVFSLFEWSEGDFNFDLKETDDELEPFVSDPQEMVLESGINPQFLAMEGARRKDEENRPPEDIPGVAPPAGEDEGAGIAPEEGAPPSPAGPAEAAPEPPRAPVVGRRVIVADDDPVTLENLERIVSGWGYETHPVSGVRDALEALDALATPREVPALVADLIMPKQDGKGMLGGLELLEESKRKKPAAPVVIITDVVDEDTERRVLELGGQSYLPKPRRSQVSRSLITPAVRDFAEALGKALIPLCGGETAEGIAEPTAEAAFGGPGSPELSRPPAEPAVGEARASGAAQGPQPVPETVPEQDSLTGIAEELKSLEGFVDFLPEAAPSQQTTPGLQLLKSMIDELISPRSHSDITLLILRFASELMNRAVLFLAKREEVCGLGQFGIVLEGDNPEKRVRAMRIPLDSPSIFREVMDRRASMTIKPADTPWNSYIFDQLGGWRPPEVFLAPIFSGGRIVTILYGDNCPEAKSIGDTTSIEIFLAQAGLALDRALLERKLKDMKPRDLEWVGE